MFNRPGLVDGTDTGRRPASQLWFAASALTTRHIPFCWRLGEGRASTGPNREDSPDRMLKENPLRRGALPAKASSPSWLSPKARLHGEPCCDRSRERRAAAPPMHTRLHAAPTLSTLSLSILGRWAGLGRGCHALLLWMKKRLREARRHPSHTLTRGRAGVNPVRPQPVLLTPGWPPVIHALPLPPPTSGL